ncbi:putative methylesterase 14, chloroplastic [Hordeum vulgare]|nr:putative methylesterase 14, chloroplastic [Hordeum vulgare]
MGSARPPRGGAAKLTPAEEELLHRQALAMAIHQHLDTGGSMSRRIDAGAGSMSRRIGPGSTSSQRHGNLPDSVTNATKASFRVLGSKLILHEEEEGQVVAMEGWIQSMGASYTRVTAAAWDGEGSATLAQLFLISS